MLVRHIVVATTYHTSEMTPKSLNVVGVNRTINNKLQLTVVTYLVIITFGVKSVVCVQLVSEIGAKSYKVNTILEIVDKSLPDYKVLSSMNVIFAS